MTLGLMTPRRRKTIIIPVTVGEDYQKGLIRRLEEYGILRKEIAEEIGVDPTQFSRWLVRSSPDTGKPISIGIENVVKIEQAIIKIREERAKEKKKQKEGE